MKRWATLGVVLLIGLASTSCNRTSARTAGRLTVDGTAEVSLVDGGVRRITGARTLRSGEQVRMIDGTAVLALGDGRQLELRKDTVVRVAFVEVAGGARETRAELVAGDLLVDSNQISVTVEAGDSRAQVTGVSRLARGLAVQVGVYQGAAGVESAGRAVSVPALRQVTVPAPGLPSRPSPLAFTAGDPWDQRYLGGAIELSGQLSARSRGLTAQLGPGTTSVAFLRQVFPALDAQPGFTATLVDTTRDVGEVVVGAGISLLGTRGTFPDRWASVFAFHDDGAPWGLVALDQGVAGQPLLESIDTAIGRAPGLPTPTQPVTPAVSSPSSPTTPTTPISPQVSVPVPVLPPPSGTGGQGLSGALPGTPGSPGGGTGATGTPGGSGTTSTPPAPMLNERGAVELGIPLVDDTVSGLVEALSGLLQALSMPAAPAP